MPDFPAAPVLVSCPPATYAAPADLPDVVDTGLPSTFQLLIGEIGGPDRGELLTALIESYSDSAIDGTPGDIRFSCSTSDLSLLATLGHDARVWGGRALCDLDDLVKFRVTPVRDGKVGQPYALRSEASVSGGRLTCTGSTYERLFQERNVGVPRRHDYLNGRGSFESGTPYSLGVESFGGCLAEIATGTAAHGAQSLRIKGDAGSRVEITTVISSSSTTPQAVTVRGGGFVRLPSDAIDDVTAMSIVVTNVSGGKVWPQLGKGDSGAANTTSDMLREEWLKDPMSCSGLLPVPPYSVYVTICLYPVSESGDEWTYFDDITIYRRDSLGTGTAKDLCYHLRDLLAAAQHGTGKSSWGLTPVVDTLTGVEEVGVWRDEDGQGLPDAFDALTGRDDGPEYPWITPDYRVHCSARRGTDRTDLQIGPDDILNRDDGWTVDAGAQASDVRAVTDRGSDYWRPVGWERDLSATGGQVIERSVQAPNGLSLNQLDAWTRSQVATLHQPQATTRVLVSMDLGMAVQVGDRLPVYREDGCLVLSRTMRAVQRTVLPPAGLVAIDFGADDA